MSVWQVGTGFAVALACAFDAQGADYQPFLHEVPPAVATHEALMTMLGVPEVHALPSSSAPGTKSCASMYVQTCMPFTACSSHTDAEGLRWLRCGCRSSISKS